MVVAAGYGHGRAAGDILLYHATIVIAEREGCILVGDGVIRTISVERKADVNGVVARIRLRRAGGKPVIGNTLKSCSLLPSSVARNATWLPERRYRSGRRYRARQTRPGWECCKSSPAAAFSRCRAGRCTSRADSSPSIGRW